MASGGKKKTTMAKLNRERRMRERRVDKQARRDARKQAAAQSAGVPDDTLTLQPDQSAGPYREAVPEAGVVALVDV
jgi:hypothetical protein